MKHKKPDKKALAGSETFVHDVVIADSEAVSGYLKEVDASEFIHTPLLEKMYKHIKKRLTYNLEGKAKEDVVLAAFIERIARTAVVLQDIEQRVLGGHTLSKEEKDFYIKQQKEHSSCLEKFKNILFTEHRKIKATVLDELSKEIHGGETRKTVKSLEIKE